MTLRVRYVLRGTFRLSIVVALAVAAYNSFDAWQSIAKHRADDRRMLATLECGSRVPEQRLKQALTEGGLIDLSKVGCADKQFIASFDELARTRDGIIREELGSVGPTFDMVSVGLFALLAFVAINLAGLVLICAWAVFAWVLAGFKPRPNARDCDAAKG
jgi:hypothetical protein